MADPVIKIHENFTISDGTSSSAFTTEDADYTPITFANKLSSDLNNTVTFGTTGGSGYLEFTNATTLTGMPNYIFAIPISDFFIKAGGRVNFRNVNLDADMTIATIKTELNPFKNEVVFTSNSAIIDAINLTNEPTAQNSYVNPIDHYTNIINDDTLFPTAFSKVSINYDGSIIACGKSSLGTLQNGAIQVYKRDTTASSGWIQIGSTIFGDDDYDNYGTTLTLSYDGQIVAGAAVRFSGVGIYGYFQAWKQDPTNTSVEPIGWSPHGDKLQGSTTKKWYFHHMSGDGNTIIWWPEDSSMSIKIYKHNSGTNAWDEITHSLSIAVKGLHFRAKLSYDGSILVMGDMAYDTFKGRVQVYERDSSDQFTQIGSDFVGTTTGNTTTGSRMGSNIAINKNGDVFSFNEHISGDWKNYVYKRDGSGWSQMGDIITEGYDGQHTMSLDDIGHSFALGSTSHYGQPTGKMYIFEYNTSDSTWSHIITNNSYQGGGLYNGYIEGGNSPILGTLIPAGYLGSSIQLSGDNSKLIVCGPSYMHIYSMPGEVVTTASSTLPAGDSFINNFVSKISTDMNQSLTYDADNANIIFDDITTDMPISITSTDTTVFDTSITEITAAEKTLHFISYGQPEPSLSDFLIDNGESLTNLLNNNVKAEDIIKKQVFTASEWDSAGIPTNKFLDTFVNNYVDVSGGFALKNGDITVYDISFNSSVYSNITDLSNSLTVNNNLFTDSDMSLNSNLYIGGDLSVNGQFSGNFANNTIPYTAIQEYESTGTSTGNVSGSIFLLGDVSFNGDTVEVKNTEKLNVHEISSNGIIMGNNNRILQYDQIAKTETEVTRDNNATCTYSRHNSIFCSADGKYVAVLLGGDTRDGNSTNSGIDISQDYGATWNMNYIRNDRHHGNFSMSQTGQYMITSVYGNTGDGNNTDHTIGYSSDFGSTWQNKNLSELIPGFNIIASWRVLSVAMSPDGSYMIIALRYNNSGGKQLWISYDQSLVDNGFNFLFYLSRNIINMTIFKSELENHDTGKYDDLILITQEFNNNSYHFIYGLSGNEITVGYVDNTDTCISSSGAIHFRSQTDGSEINRYDLKGQNLHRPLITDIKSDLGSPGERMSFIMSPNGRHIIAAPYNNNGTNNPNIKHTSKIKYSNNGGYTWQSVDPLISTTLTTLAGSCISDEGHMYVVDKLSNTQVKYIAARFNYVNKLFTQLDVIDTATVNGTISTTSDSRVKEDIEELNDKDTVDNLKPIEYDNILSKKHEYGLIAHELQEEYPYLVKGEKDGEDNQTINYQGIIGILVKEIQDLKKQIQLL